MKAVLVLLLVTVSLCAALSPDLNEKMRFRRRRAFPDDWTWGASTGVVCPSLTLTTVTAPMQPETISYKKADGTTASFTFPKCGAKPEGDQRKTCVNEAYDGMVPVLDLAKKTFDTFLFDLVHDINKNLNPTGAAGNIKDAALSQDTAHLVSVRLKQKGPATEKILKTTANEGYDGEPRRLIDAVRASVVFKDFTNLAKAVCFLRKSAKAEGAKVAIIKEKDNTKTTDAAKTMGYLDYKFTLKVGGEGGNGLLSEVQFLVCPLFHAKMGKLDEGENGHTLYEKWRVLPADSAERKPLADKSIELYAKYTPPNGAKVSSVKCVDSINEEKVEASFDKPTSPDSA